MYRGFLKSLLRVRKTTNRSILLAQFGKFPFEHFAWGQVLMYYNCVSMVIKDRILGKAFEAQLSMFDAGNKCCARSLKKWLLMNQPQEVACIVPLVQLSLETAPQPLTIHALHTGTTQPINQDPINPTPSKFSPHNVECKKGEG